MLAITSLRAHAPEERVDGSDHVGRDVILYSAASHWLERFCQMRVIFKNLAIMKILPRLSWEVFQVPFNNNCLEAGCHV